MAKRPVSKVIQPGLQARQITPPQRIIAAGSGSCVTESSGGTGSGGSTGSGGQIPVPLPVRITNPASDFEIVCASTDSRPLAFNTGTGALTELDGSAIADGAVAALCPQSVDYEKIETCLENDTGRWFKVKFINTENSVDIVGPFFVNPQGDIVADPGDLLPCAIEDMTQTVHGVLVASGTTFTLPAGVQSFAVSVQGSGNFDMSFDRGISYALTQRVGSRVWGQGEGYVIENSDEIVIRSQGDVDVIWEEK